MEEEKKPKANFKLSGKQQQEEPNKRPLFLFQKSWARRGDSTKHLLSFYKKTSLNNRELSQPNEPLDADIAEEDETRLLDTSGAEELSVKTLADMFDFRLGEQVHTFSTFTSS